MHSFILKNLTISMAIIFSTNMAAGAAKKCDPYQDACKNAYHIPNIGYLDVYQTFALEEHNQAIKRAVIVIHGNGRNPTSGFKSIFRAAQKKEMVNKTIILAPHFKGNDYAGAVDCSDDKCDAVLPGEMYWTTSGWKQGDHSVHPQASYSAFSVLDDLIGRLNQEQIFPNLTTIVVVGHSAGGQFAQRYAVGSKIGQSLRLGLEIEYVVANPSTYMYLSPERPDWAGLHSEGGQYTGKGLGASLVSAPDFLNPYIRSVKPFVEEPVFNPIRSALNSAGGSECQCNGAPPCSYERYKYGINLEPLNPDHYMCSANSYQSCSYPFTSNEMIKNFLAKRVTYILGQLDNSFNPETDWTNDELDTRCGANFQGPDRLTRGMYYFEHLKAYGPHNHRILYAAEVGHRSEGIYVDSYRARRAIFGGKIPKEEYLGATYTFQHKYNMRYLDALPTANNDTVTRQHEPSNLLGTDSSQRWIITRVSGDEYRIMQELTLRYLDAYTSSSKNHSVMTRKYQDNQSQIWVIKAVEGEPGMYTVRQKQNLRYLDAYTSSRFHDYTSMTRTYQNDATQKWYIRPAP